MTDLEKAARLVVLAFEAHRTHHEHGCVYLDPAIELLRKVILEAEQPAQQEPVDWEKLYRLEVKKKEALAVKYERDIKPLTKIVPMAQPAQQEPVGQLMEEAYGRGQVLWFNKPHDLSMLYTSPPARKPWVGLTGDEISECWGTGNVVAAVNAKLKEKNT